MASSPHALWLKRERAKPRKAVRAQGKSNESGGIGAVLDLKRRKIDFPW
jgi:hypothetical protein